jgi:hypothetical protein
MRSKLKGVLGEIAPLDSAIIKLNQSERILADSVKAGLITKEQESHYLTLLDEYYSKLLDPIGQLNEEIDDQARLLGMTAKAREVEAQVLDASQSLLERGVVLTQEETVALREKFTALQSLNTMTQLQDELLANSVDQRQAYIDQLAAINTLMANTDTGFNKADAGGAVSSLVATMGLDPSLLQANIDSILGQTQTMYDQIKQLRDANVISEQEAAGLRAQAWVQSQQLQLQTASNFFGDLAQLQRSESSKMAKVGKAAAIAQAIINTYQSATAAYASLAGIPYVGPALGVAAAAAAIAAGMANVQAIRKQPVGGYMVGGYTGDIGRTQVAGTVHGREYVMDATTTSRIGRSNLDALRSGDATVATRGSNSEGGGTGAGVVNVSIENHGSAKDFEVQQLSPTDVRIIARDEAERVVTKRVPEMVSSDIRNPNSSISKSLNGNTQAGRRR